MDPTPISFGITELNIGGAEKSLVELVLRLDRARWRPSVVSLMPLGPLADRLRGKGVPVESLDVRSVWSVPRGLRRWREILRRERPRLLVTFLFHANLLGRLACRKVDGCGHVSSVRVAERGVAWHLWLDRATRAWTDHYVCVSESVAIFTCEQLSLPTTQVTVIPNGVDLAAADAATPIDTRPFGIEPDERILLSVGRLCPQKGTDVALRVLEKVGKTAGVPGFRLVMVGDGPLRKDAEIWCQAHGLEKRVYFVGTQENVWAWMKRSSGLLLTSRWEGMPNVVLEAMASGLPVIASDADGTRELVLPEVTGWLARVGNVEEFAHAIVDWASRPEIARARGAAGRQRVESTFTIERNVAAWERLLNERTRTPSTSAEESIQRLPQ